VVPPMIVAEIAALIMPIWPVAIYAVVAVSVILLLVSVPMLRGLERKWADASFSFVNTGQ
jgi:hypothetical protein